MSKLFTPITLRGLEIRNRAWVPPMCMYSVPERDGVANQWHLVHYGTLAQGGFGLIIVEATAVSEEGRITPNCLGLWTKTHLDAFRDITDFVHTQGAKIGVQLAHAGRKASTYRGFPGEATGWVPEQEGGWTTIAPSAIPFSDQAPTPNELTVEGIDTVVEQFRKAARRARKAGFDVIELHMAHGYLLHEFLSPLSNHRSDQYGGDFDARIKLPLRVVDEVRRVWNGPLIVRLSATEWRKDGWTIDDSIRFARILKSHDVDMIDCSSGGNAPASIELSPGYQVSLARDIKYGAQIPTSAVGLIQTPELAEEILSRGDADAVRIGRAALRDPYWAIRAGKALGLENAQLPIQPQTMRGWKHA